MREVKREISQPILVVKKGNHTFRFGVNVSGAVEYTLDDGDVNRISKLDDGKVFFKESLELYINGAVENVDTIQLDELDYAILKSEQNTVMAKNDKSASNLKEFRVDNKTKKELMSMIDKWQKKTKVLTTKVDKQKKKEKYTIHTFMIGREMFRMIEREREGTVIVNPDYKIFMDYERAGGLAAQEGELVVWKYYYEKDEQSEVDPSRKKGYWATARKMTFNEQICYEIIKRYGTFAAK
ncbi:MAG: hypothetical protein E7290_10235 [Lachnospiraceae bacterium]|nr:hypothetical protein [Lachnospiraceae bacterium]